MNIGIMGMGFVGGTTAKVLERVHTIFSYDIDPNKHYDSREHLESLTRNSEVVFVCVPTPMKPSGKIDYNPIHNSLNTLVEASVSAKRNLEEILVTIRSTAVSGTTDALASAYPFPFAFNPEFLREKYALEDMENTDRIVLGVEDEKSRDKLLAVYKPLFPNAEYFIYDRKTAEMVKYANNAQLAVQIAGANEIYFICQALKIDYNKVREVLLCDKRIGTNTEVPGHDGDFGFGGKCLPKDLNALIYLARSTQYRPYLLEEIWRLNERVRKDKDWLRIPGATSP